MTKKEKMEKVAMQLSYLREILKGGDRLHCVEINTSNTGTTRMKVFFAHSEEVLGEVGIVNLTYAMAMVLGYRFNRNDNTIVVPGCGYSKPQHLADHLSAVLFGSEGKLGYTWI